MKDCSIEVNPLYKWVYKKIMIYKHKNGDKMYLKLLVFIMLIQVVSITNGSELDVNDMLVEHSHELQTHLASVPVKTKSDAYWKPWLNAELKRVNQAVVAARTDKEQDEARASLLKVDELIAALQTGRLGFDKCIVRIVKAISNRRIYPNSPISSGILGAPLLVVATPGEYESASFAITAEENLPNLTVKLSALSTRNGETIPPTFLDMKVVKAWYQDEGGPGYIEDTPAFTFNPVSYTYKKVLVPELLLHDDSMIRVDLDKQQNYIKLGGPNGVDYICISDKKGVPGKTIKDFLVYDAKTLLPTNLDAGMNKQFWLTVHVPENSVAGIYEGSISIFSESHLLGTLPLKIRVLPFRFAPSRYMSGLCHYAPDKEYYGDKQIEQYRKENENMVAHSIQDAIFRFDILKNPEAFEMRKAAGMNCKTILYSGWRPDMVKKTKDRDLLSEVKRLTKKHLEAFRAQGVETVYFYGKDEGRGKVLKSQTETWNAVHEVGGKMFVAGYYGKNGNYDLMGDIQDLFQCAGYPLRDEAKKWHSKDHKILCYANPQSGVEAPDTYRRNYGLLLWQNEYDGPLDYIYHWGMAQRGAKIGARFPCVWNDFCRIEKYKQHNFVYPTSDGVIDTMAWEGYREAADDLRYMSTLLDFIDVNSNSHLPAVQRAVSKAKAYLSDLKEREINVHKLDMDILRTNIIDLILDIQNSKEKN